MDGGGGEARCIPSSLGSWSSGWGACVCLVYLTASLVTRDLIGWGEYGTTIVGYSCIFLIFWDLLVLLEYVSVLYEKDDGGDDE